MSPDPVQLVLFFAAEPGDLAQLRLGQETRLIQDVLDLTKGSYDIEQRHAAQPVDLQRWILKRKPAFVHFSGHGESAGVVLEGEGNTKQPVPPDALAALFALLTVRVGCVVLNCCYSEDHARKIAKHVPFAVGMKGKIRDEAAIHFSNGFYYALFNGEPVDKAFEHGRVLIHLNSGQSGGGLVPRTVIPPGAGGSAPGALEDHEMPVLFGPPAQAGGAGQPPPARDPSAGPAVFVVLMVTAEPSTQAILVHAAEYKRVQNCLARSAKRALYRVESRPAVSPNLLQQDLLQSRPAVVHFSGHEGWTDGLALEDDAGRTQQVPPAALAELFALLGGWEVQCVVLSGCYSDLQAEMIARHVSYVVGIRPELGNRAAADFSAGFYTTLFAGLSVPQAFGSGWAAIRADSLPESVRRSLADPDAVWSLPEHLAPVLLSRE